MFLLRLYLTIYANKQKSKPLLYKANNNLKPRMKEKCNRAKKEHNKNKQINKKIKKKNYEDGFQMLFGLVLMHLNVKRMCTVYNQN